MVRMRGARPARRRTFEQLLPCFPLPGARPPWRREALLTRPRTQQNAESVLRNSPLALRNRRETAQQIEPSRHRNSRSLNNRQIRQRSGISRKSSTDRSAQEPYLPRLRSSDTVILCHRYRKHRHSALALLPLSVDSRQSRSCKHDLGKSWSMFGPGVGSGHCWNSNGSRGHLAHSYFGMSDCTHSWNASSQTGKYLCRLDKNLAFAEPPQ